MAQVKRSIELDAPVDTIHAQWLRFEALPRCPVHSLAANVRWRAEVLTLEPLEKGTRVTLKLEYDPGGDDAKLALRLEAALQAFRAFFERVRQPAMESHPA